MSLLQVRTRRHLVQPRGPVVQELSQLLVHVLLQGVQARPLGETPQDLPLLQGGLAVSPSHRGRQRETRDSTPPLGDRTQGVPLPRTGRRQVLLPRARSRREVPRGRLGEPGRAHVHLLEGPPAFGDGHAALHGDSQNVQALQPRRQARAVRVRVCGVGSPGRGRREVGTPAGVQVRQDASEQRRAGARERHRDSGDAHPHVGPHKARARQALQGDQLRQHPTTSATTRSFPAQALPGSVQAAPDVRRGELRQVQGGDGVPPRRHHGQDLHVHHHAGV